MIHTIIIVSFNFLWFDYFASCSIHKYHLFHIHIMWLPFNWCGYSSPYINVIITLHWIKPLKPNVYYHAFTRLLTALCIYADSWTEFFCWFHFVDLKVFLLLKAQNLVTTFKLRHSVTQGTQIKLYIYRCSKWNLRTPFLPFLS